MGSDLKQEPGESVLDRLVNTASPVPAPAPVTLSPNPSSDKESESKDRVKVAFYLKTQQRDNFDRLLVEARALLPKAEGRRLDQSALLRIVLAGVMDDFAAHQDNVGKSRLAQWLAAERDSQ
jgi:hypothetical protein